MNRMKLPPVTAIDVIAIVGLVLLSVGLSLALTPAAGLVAVGAALLLYAIAVSASTQTPS